MWLECNRRNRHLTCSPAGLWSWQGGTCPNEQTLNGYLPPGESRHRRPLTHLHKIICFTVIAKNNILNVVPDLAYEIMKIFLRGEAVQGVDDCANLPAKQNKKKKCNVHSQLFGDLLNLRNHISVTMAKEDI